MPRKKDSKIVQIIKKVRNKRKEAIKDSKPFVDETKSIRKPTIVERVPWKKTAIASDIPLTLDYFNGTIYEALEQTRDLYPDYIAFDFMGRHTTYKKMCDNIEQCAKALKVLGVRENDCVLIAMPNCPQAIYMIYAVNLIGGIANIIHPLSAEKEIEEYLNTSKAVTAITLDQFYHKFESIRDNTNLVNIVIASIKDEVSKKIKAGYMLTEGYKIKHIPNSAPVIRWNKFMKLSKQCFYSYRVNRRGKDPAIMLYSGGTTGTTKGIILSNNSINALGKQIVTVSTIFKPGDKMLAAMPLFHGFGLGVCVHSMLSQGGRCILVPRLTPKSYAKALLKYKCNYIAGVPTLYESLLRLPAMENKDLSFLKGCFCGGDSLSIELKKRVDEFLRQHNANVQVREGYGATETVNACCLTPPHMYKEGSIGIPFPDTYIKIVEPNSDKELPYGKEGEILISGPTLMECYWNNEEETKLALRKSKVDGLTWLYTGDLGSMDKDGYIYFKGRLKRMIITSGYNVYPSQVERILETHPFVEKSCVIGVPDSYKMQKIKAFVILKHGVSASEETKTAILSYCRKHLAKYEMPYNIEFKDELPRTKVGKVAYKVLEQEELNKLKESA